MMLEQMVSIIKEANRLITVNVAVVEAGAIMVELVVVTMEAAAAVVVVVLFMVVASVI